MGRPKATRVQPHGLRWVQLRRDDPFVGSFRGLRGWIHRRKLAVSSRGGDMSAVRKVSPEEEAYKYSAARFL